MRLRLKVEEKTLHCTKPEFRYIKHLTNIIIYISLHFVIISLIFSGKIIRQNLRYSDCMQLNFKLI